MTVIHGDCGEVMSRMFAASVDAIVTDPPYGLSFMGKGWDHGVPGVEYWDEALRVAKPGSYLLAFGGTRTFHRLGVALEDAGFEVHDCLSWLYGSGFPKHKSKLKPAWEPIVLARKPAPKATPLNVDACRIEAQGRPCIVSKSEPSVNAFGNGLNGSACAGVTNLGRWPANVVLDEEAAAALDEQSGELPGGNHPASRRGIGFTESSGRKNAGTAGERRAMDSGGASRFYYCAKASRAEREAGLEGFDEAPAGALKSGDGGWRNEEARGRQPRHDTQHTARNVHPTVKPVALMRWLVRLVTPPNGLVLDPFAGSGTTGVACVHEGRRFIGCELSEEYAAIANARIAHARAA